MAKDKNMKLFFSLIIINILYILKVSIKFLKYLKEYFKNIFFLSFFSTRFLPLVKRNIKIVFRLSQKLSFLKITFRKIGFITKNVSRKVFILTYLYVTKDRILPYLEIILSKVYKKILSGVNKEREKLLKSGSSCKKFCFLTLFLLWFFHLTFVVAFFPLNLLRIFLVFLGRIIRKVYKIDFWVIVRSNILGVFKLLRLVSNKIKIFFVNIIKLFFYFLTLSKALIIKGLIIFKSKLICLSNILNISTTLLQTRVRFNKYLIKLFDVVSLFFSTKILLLKLYRFLVKRKYFKLRSLLIIFRKYEYLRIPLLFVFKFVFLALFIVKKVVFSVRKRVLSLSYILKMLYGFISLFKKIIYISSDFVHKKYNLLIKLFRFIKSIKILKLLNRPITILKNKLFCFKKYFYILICLLRRTLGVIRLKLSLILGNLKIFKKIFVFTNIFWLIGPFVWLVKVFLFFLYKIVFVLKNFIFWFSYNLFDIVVLSILKRIINSSFKKRSDIDYSCYKFKEKLANYFKSKMVFSLSFFKKNIIFLKIIGFANWIKHGYFISIFLIISLLGLSFNALTFYNNGNNIKDPTVCYEKESFKVFSNYFKNFKETSDCKSSSVVVTDEFTENSVILEIDAPVIVGPKNVHNISLKELTSGLKTGYIRDHKIFITKRIKEKFFKTYDIPVSDSIDYKKSFFIISFEELEPYMNVVMVNGYYPSKSMILSNLYPFANIVVANFKENCEEELKTAFKFRNTLSSMVLGGDILLDRGVKSKIESKGVDYIIEELKKIFNTADISFANLECPISNRGSKFNIDKGLFFRCDPKYLEVLKKLGIDILSLANNHILDYGLTAALDTLNYLDEEKILYTGMGLDRNEAILSPILEINGKKIRILAYNDISPYSYNAEENVPGLLILNKSDIASDIKIAKKGVDYLFVSIHTGQEFVLYPEEEKVKLFKYIIDLGADGILGGHPHTFQPIEFYKGKPIIYSLGNLIFDQYRLGKELQEQMVVEVNFYNGNIKYIYPHFFKINEDLKPFYIKGDSEEFLYLVERARMDYSRQLAKK